MAALRLGVPGQVPMTNYTQHWSLQNVRPAHVQVSDGRSFSQYSHGCNPRVLP